MKYNEGISSWTIIFIIAFGIIFTVVVASRMAINEGMSSYEKAYQKKEKELCSNSEYSTKVSLYYGVLPEIDKVAVALDDESKEKLKNAVQKKGSSALEGVGDLTCLEGLALKPPVADVSALSQLDNLKVLSLALEKGTDVSPIFSLDNLVLLYLSRSEISKEKCKRIKQELPEVEVKCPKSNKEQS